MATEGTVRPWGDTFRVDLLPCLFDLIIESWKTFPQPASHDLEVPITKRFCVHLENSKDRSTHLFRIDWEANLLDNTATHTGRIDIRVTHGYMATEYFSFECKLLNKTDHNGRWYSLAGEYIEEGVMRYVTGQYSGGDNGGMIGYVMDGDITKAIQHVNRAIQTRQERLRINHQPQLRNSSIRPHCPQTRQTDHLTKTGPFRIHHVFLPLASSN
ncbi:MAG TPA: hypothetical protein VMX13_10015 [Sedimentisphaerales bacterium]|nr:hypothetical protein [Sedimentisphaerales bacterium]